MPKSSIFLFLLAQIALPYLLLHSIDEMYAAIEAILSEMALYGWIKVQSGFGAVQVTNFFLDSFVNRSLSQDLLVWSLRVLIVPLLEAAFVAGEEVLTNDSLQVINNTIFEGSEDQTSEFVATWEAEEYHEQGLLSFLLPCRLYLQQG